MSSSSRNILGTLTVLILFYSLTYKGESDMTTEPAAATEAEEKDCGCQPQRTSDTAESIVSNLDLRTKTKMLSSSHTPKDVLVRALQMQIVEGAWLEKAKQAGY
jgi:hypothetical protein